MMLFLLIAVCFVSKIQSFAHDLPHFVAGNMHSIAAAFHINSFQIASEGVGNTLLSLLDLPKLPPIPDIELPQIPAIELPQIEVDAILPAVSNAGAKLGSDLGKSGEILTGNTLYALTYSFTNLFGHHSGNTLGGIKNVANAVNEISSGIQTIGVPKTQEYFSKLTDAVKVVPDIDLKATLPDLDKVQNDALAWKLFPDNHMETGYWENKIKAIQNAKADDFANPLGIYTLTLTQIHPHEHK